MFDVNTVEKWPSVETLARGAVLIGPGWILGGIKEVENKTQVHRRPICHGRQLAGRHLPRQNTPQNTAKGTRDERGSSAEGENMNLGWRDTLNYRKN